MTREDRARRLVARLRRREWAIVQTIRPKGARAALLRAYRRLASLYTLALRVWIRGIGDRPGIRDKLAFALLCARHAVATHGPKKTLARKRFSV
jgi:hypothetical protein